MLRSFAEYLKRSKERRKFSGEIDDNDLNDEEAEIIKRRVKRNVNERESYDESNFFRGDRLRILPAEMGNCSVIDMYTEKLKIGHI
jgi:hypothetical protein